MKKIYALLAVCAASVVLMFSSGNLSPAAGASAAPKSYVLTLVEKGKKIKVLTPARIQSGAAAPEEFSVYTAGKIEDVEITLIDANKNEAYDEKGTDAFIIGNLTYALPVSRIINIKNKLYECEIETSGERITLTPYQGDVGEVDMLSDFKCPLKPEMLILKSDDIYLDAAKSNKAIVPCGSYNLWLGYIVDRKYSLAIKSNEMKAIDVVKEEDKDGKPKAVKIQWGGPYKLDCDCSIQDGKVSITESVSVYGASGEEYYNFTPSLLPAAMEIFDNTKKSVAKGIINRSVAPVAKSFTGIRRDGGYATAAAGAAAANIPDAGVKGGYNGVIKKGAEGPYTLKILIKNSVLGELKGEKEIK